jgi:hypothetical protein
MVKRPELARPMMPRRAGFYADWARWHFLEERRLGKASIVEALQEAAFFIMDAPAPTPESRTFRRHVFEGDDGE